MLEATGIADVFVDFFVDDDRPVDLVHHGLQAFARPTFASNDTLEMMPDQYVYCLILRGQFDLLLRKHLLEDRPGIIYLWRFHNQELNGSRCITAFLQQGICCFHQRFRGQQAKLVAGGCSDQVEPEVFFRN